MLPRCASTPGSPRNCLYGREADSHAFVGLQLLTLDGDRVSRITAFMDAALAARFSLPHHLAPTAAPLANQTFA